MATRIDGSVPVSAEIDAPYRVTDLKQWVYCPRILYYAHCLPDIRPVTYKMTAGVSAGIKEEGREERRSLHVYGVKTGRRQFNVPVSSSRLGLRGTVDMVIWQDEPSAQVIPVDYKNSIVPGIHFKLQLTAYGVMLEEASGYSAQRGFLYSILDCKAVLVKLNAPIREVLFKNLDAMHAMLYREQMPDPAPQINKCTACEFRRFCNDIY